MLSRDEILKRTDNGLDVFKHYIPGQWRVGRNFHNPLHEDRKASCNVYFDRRTGSYRLKDFGNDEYSGDCFATVGRIYGLNCSSSAGFVEILKTINHDLRLGLNEGDSSFYTPVSPKPAKKIDIPKVEVPIQPDTPTRQPETPKKVKPYSIVQQSFSAKETAFWKQTGITPDILKTYKVFSLREFSSENNDGKPFSFHSSDAEPIFGYVGKRHVKIYRPFSDIRFLYGGNPGDNYCFGLEQLPSKGDTLFITGGEKDVLSPVSKGFHAICFNSETSNIPKSLIKKLSHRFKHIVLLYDTDKTGLDASLRHEKELRGPGVKRPVLPLSGTKDEKDISDFFKPGNTSESFLQLFIELLDGLYSETMSILKSCEIDFTSPPASSGMLISINDVPLGTQGNLLGITGGKGTGKSNFVGSLVAGTVRQNENVDTPGTNVQRNSAGEAVLLYDTEQSEVQLYLETYPGY